MRARILGFWLPVLALALAGTIPQHFYMQRSEAITPGALVELPFVSSTGLIKFYERRKGTWADTVFSDSINYSAIPIQAYYIKPSRLIFLSADWYDSYSDPRRGCQIDPCVFVASPDRFDVFAKLRAQRNMHYWRWASFSFPVGNRMLPDRFRYDLRGSDEHLKAGTQVIAQVRESILNHWPAPPAAASDIYRVGAPSGLRNHLVFVSGSMGIMHGSILSGPVGLYGVEEDPFDHSRVMAALGRYLLFRAIAPSRRGRLVLAITRSFNGPGHDELPPAVAIGSSRVPFRLVGHGSARVFSNTISPKSIAGMRFFGIDIGRKPAAIPQPPRSFLMRLYGKSIVMDSRTTAAWARDIALIDDREYARLKRPSSVAQFPADLADPALEYSGMYEDGWMSDRAYFVLRSSRPSATLAVNALVPFVGDAAYRTQFCVRVDGAKPACKPQAPGEFRFTRTVKSAGPHTIELDVARPQSPGGADRRSLGARIEFVGFKT